MKFVTALLILLASAFAITKGFEVVGFSIATRRAVSDEDRSDAIKPWMTTSGLSYAAREAHLRAVAGSKNPPSTADVGEEIAAILAARPLSSTYWISAAALSFSMGRSERAKKELMMSIVTGPNEGEVMGRRGAAAVLLWEILPDDLRQSAVSDLALVNLTPGERAQIAYGIGMQSPQARQRIKETLVSSGKIPNHVLGTLGLPADAGAPNKQ